LPDETTLYEAMYILDVTLDEETQQQAVTAIEDAIAEHGGQVEQTLTFGQRKLAYAIANHVEGLYMITYFRGPGAVVTLLNQEFSLIDTIVRGMVVIANPKSIFTEPEPAAPPPQEFEPPFAPEDEPATEEPAEVGEDEEVEEAEESVEAAEAEDEEPEAGEDGEAEASDTQEDVSDEPAPQADEPVVEEDSETAETEPSE
jgi:ribosomal protein S6